MIRQAVVENHVTLMIGEMKRYDPGYLLGRNLIRNMKGLKLIRFLGLLQTAFGGPKTKLCRFT